MPELPEVETIARKLRRTVAGKKYPIRIEHHKGTYEATKDWKAKLSWQTPTIPREIIPSTAFYLPEGLRAP